MQKFSIPHCFYILSQNLSYSFTKLSLMFQSCRYAHKVSNVQNLLLSFKRHHVLLLLFYFDSLASPIGQITTVHIQECSKISVQLLLFSSSFSNVGVLGNVDAHAVTCRVTIRKLKSCIRKRWKSLRQNDYTSSGRGVDGGGTVEKNQRLEEGAGGRGLVGGLGVMNVECHSTFE